jgi:pyruvate-formate lyase-activating enzyme
MALKSLPNLLVADSQGRIFKHPFLKAAPASGLTPRVPLASEFIPLPLGSEVFFLPGRKPWAYNETLKQLILVDKDPAGNPVWACAAFAAPAYTLTGLAAFKAQSLAPVLPMFAYGAVGVYKNRFYICARRVDSDKRQDPAGFDQRKVKRGAALLVKKYPDNRLLKHLTSCALTYGCPAARNLCLGRFEGPLPTARACNAFCVGCLSAQPANSGFPCTQPRIKFTPTVKEIVEVAVEHLESSVAGVVSFGQGCEGEPLTNASLLAKAVTEIRKRTSNGTINCNTNASKPKAVAGLVSAGLDAMRISLNSAQKKWYLAYFRPRDYKFEDVISSALTASRGGVKVAFNYFVFPGVTDREKEVEAFLKLIETTRVDMIQWRNLNLDPQVYLKTLGHKSVSKAGRVLGVENAFKLISESFPKLRHGYFNPAWRSLKF